MRLLCMTQFRGIDSEDCLLSPAVRIPLHPFTCPAFGMLAFMKQPSKVGCFFESSSICGVLLDL